MNGVISLLDPITYDRVEGIWRLLEERCALKGIRVTPYPHFSWHLAQDYQIEALGLVLQDLAKSARPFPVRCAGLGIFAGEIPVLYIALVKDEPLLRFHQLVWQACERVASQPLGYYAPGAWVPHITLAYGDVTREKLNCALQELAFQPLAWEITINNLALVCQEGSEVGKLRDRFDFPVTEEPLL